MVTRVSHESLMEQLQATPEWRAVSNDDMALLKKLIAKKEQEE